MRSIVQDEIRLACALAAARQGDLAAARRQLATDLRAEPTNVTAWFWMSQLLGTRESRAFCLEKVLELDTQNAAAKAGLAFLRQRTGERGSSDTAPRPGAATESMEHALPLESDARQQPAKIQLADDEFWRHPGSHPPTGAVGFRTKVKGLAGAEQSHNRWQPSALTRGSHRTSKGMALIVAGLLLLTLAVALMLPVRHPALIAVPTIIVSDAVLNLGTGPDALAVDATAVVPEVIPLPLVEETPAPSPSPSATPAQASLGRLHIPDLGVNLQVMAVPIRDGNWDISRLGAQVGWLDSTGRFPRDDLAMVFIGHVTLSALRNGPFYGVRFLRPGDLVLYTWNEVDHVYRVEEVSTVLPEQAEQLYLADGHSLLLVTCTGWDYSTQDYTRRAVARAVLQ
jgi:LPXTG-site transpeptidase (sortase) family protein